MNTMQRPVRYSNRISRVKASCVRDLMARLGTDVISFAAGLPNPALFPAAAIADSAAAVLAADAASALQYGSTEGYRPLREWIAEHVLRPRGIDAEADEVLITSGSQQALDLVGKVFLDPGDTVLLERPAYMAAIQAFDLCQAAYVDAPMEEEGIDIPAVERRLETHDVRLMYIVPTFHNPTGLSYSDATRERLASVLRKHACLLIEDEPYAELRYDGSAGRSIAALRGGRSIMTGTFSKVFTPGFRLGWLYADQQTIRQLVVAKQASDLCCNQFTQRLLHHYLMNYDLRAHIETLCACYRIRRDAMHAALLRHMPPGVRWTRPAGGMFIWVTLPKRLDAARLLERAAMKRVVFAPGESFYTQRPQRNTIRLNFTHSEPDAMEQGIGILAAEVASLMDE